MGGPKHGRPFQENRDMGSATITLLAILFPSSAILIGLYFAWGMPLISNGEIMVDSLVFLFPIVIGSLAAPGYLYYLINRNSHKPQSRILHIWIGASLIGGMIASLTGVIGFYTVIGIPSIVGSMFCSIWLAIHFFKRR